MKRISFHLSSMACQLTACFIFAFACWMSSEAKAPQLKALSHYRAAVFQHSRVKNGECPVWSMMQNVQRYRQIAIHAAAEGAEIIVFPEIGLGGNAISRKINMRFGEDVPDAKDQLTPCNFLNTTYCSNRCVCTTTFYYLSFLYASELTLLLFFFYFFLFFIGNISFHLYVFMAHYCRK